MVCHWHPPYITTVPIGYSYTQEPICFLLPWWISSRQAVISPPVRLSSYSLSGVRSWPSWTWVRTGPTPQVRGSRPVRGWTGPYFLGPGPGGEWTGPWGRTWVGPGLDLIFETLYNNDNIWYVYFILFITFFLSTKYYVVAFSFLPATTTTTMWLRQCETTTTTDGMFFILFITLFAN